MARTEGDRAVLSSPPLSPSGPGTLESGAGMRQQAGSPQPPGTSLEGGQAARGPEGQRQAGGGGCWQQDMTTSASGCAWAPRDWCPSGGAGGAAGGRELEGLPEA